VLLRSAKHHKGKAAQASTYASYVVAATEITKRRKPFKKGEFFKGLMLKVADIVCR